MALLEASVLIDRPVGDVWDYVTTAENLPVWVPVLHEVTQLSDGPLEVGTRWQGTMRLIGIGFSARAEFTQCDPNKVAELASVESRLRFSCTIMFEAVDGKTRFTYRTDTASGFDGLFGRFAGPIVSTASKRALRASLKNLARALSENG